MKRINITYTPELTAARNHAADVLFKLYHTMPHDVAISDYINANAATIATIDDDVKAVVNAETAATMTADKDISVKLSTLFAITNEYAATIDNDNAAARRNNYDVAYNNGRSYIAELRRNNAIAYAERIAENEDSTTVPVFDNDSVFDIGVILAISAAVNMHKKYGGLYAAELLDNVLANNADGQDITSVGYNAVTFAFIACGSHSIAMRVGHKAVNAYLNDRRTDDKYDITRISQAKYLRALNGMDEDENDNEDIEDIDEPAIVVEDTFAARIARNTLAKIAEKVELNKTQKTIVAMTASGFSTREIASHLNCGKSTVNRNLNAVREKCLEAGVNVGLDYEIYRFAIERKERAEAELTKAYSDGKNNKNMTHKSLNDVRAEYDRHINKSRVLQEQANNTPDVVTYKFDRAAVDNAAEQFDATRAKAAEERAINRSMVDNIPANATPAERAKIIRNAATATTLDRQESVTPAAIVNKSRAAAINAAAYNTAIRVSIEQGEKSSHKARRNKANAARKAAEKAVETAENTPAVAAEERAKIERVAAAEREYYAAHSALHSMRAAQYEANKAAYIAAHKADIDRAIAKAAARRADYETGNADKRRTAAITGKRITAIRNGNAAAARIALDNARERFNARNHIRTATPAPAAIVAEKTTIPFEIAAERIAEYDRAIAANTPAALTDELTAAIAAENAARAAAKNRNTTRNKCELTAAVDRRKSAAMALYKVANDLYTNCGRNDRTTAAELLKLALDNI